MGRGVHADAALSVIWQPQPGPQTALLACPIFRPGSFGTFSKDSLAPIQTPLREIGDWALRFLVIGLANTPVRIMTGWGEPMHYRRMIGLFAFLYAFLHLASYVGLEQFFDWRMIAGEIVKRPFIAIGMTAFALLIPLAATSTKGMVKRVGARRWKALHRAVYAVAVLVVIHFYMMIKADFREPIIYGVIVAMLLSIRGFPALRRAARRRAKAVRPPRLSPQAA